MNLVEIHNIKKSHQNWKSCDKLFNPTNRGFVLNPIKFLSIR